MDIKDVDVSSLNGVTHVFSFDKVFLPEIWNHMYDVVNTSKVRNITSCYNVWNANLVSKCKVRLLGLQLLNNS